MLKKEISTALTPAYANFSFPINSTPSHRNRGVKALFVRMENGRAIRFLARLYSQLMEEEVSPRRTLCLLHAQIAGFCLLFPAPLPFIYRVVCLCWMLIACFQCRSQNFTTHKEA